MKATALMIALLLSSSADQLAATTVKSLRLKVPAAWKSATEGGTRTWAAPSGDAEFALDVFPLEGRAIDPDACVAKLIAAVGGEPKQWQKAKVGGSPAAVRAVLDATTEQKDAFQTRTYVGCDGRTKWGLTFSMRASKAERYAALANDVVQSIAYTQGAK